jgi:hypothetical protein
MSWYWENIAMIANETFIFKLRKEGSRPGLTDFCGPWRSEEDRVVNMSELASLPLGKI